MNFVITSACNKGCSYCFAAYDRTQLVDNSEMDFDTFKELLDKVPKDNYSINILGGEPTQHTQFKKFIDEVLRRGINLTLISNFLFNQDITDFIINKLTKHNITFLINSTDLDIKNRINKFSNNYNSIYNYLYTLDKEESMYCGITFDNNKDVKYYINYLDFLYKHLNKIEILRMSVNFPGNPRDKGKFDIINNKDVGEKLLLCTKKVLDLGTVPIIDCVTYPCLFNNKEEYKYVQKFAGGKRHICGLNAPSDIFKDMKMSFCYPLKGVIETDISNYENLVDASNNLKLQYKIIEHSIKQPQVCLDCIFFKKNICKGPSLCFHNLNKPE